MFNFWARKCFCQSVGNHILCGTVDQFDLALGHNPTDEVELYINVFCPSMVLMVTC
jgi:hypothetical protein